MVKRERSQSHSAERSQRTSRQILNIGDEGERREKRFPGLSLGNNILKNDFY